MLYFLLICFINLKLELLTQFPAPNEWKLYFFMKHRHPPNWDIWLTEHLSQTILSILIIFRLILYGLKLASTRVYPVTAGVTSVVFIPINYYLFKVAMCRTENHAYIRVFIFYSHIKYHILNMLKIKCDIKQQDLKRVNLHFLKSE